MKDFNADQRLANNGEKLHPLLRQPRPQSNFKKIVNLPVSIVENSKFYNLFLDFVKTIK